MRSGQIMRIKSMMMVLKNSDFLLRFRIGHVDLHQKTVELRFRQWIGAFKFNRVLGSEHSKEFRKTIGSAINADLAFFHGLKQGRLGAWRHAVNFVAQQQIGKQWATMQREDTGRKIENIAAQDVRWHEIRGALHALEVQGKQ